MRKRLAIVAAVSVVAGSAEAQQGFVTGSFTTNTPGPTISLYSVTSSIPRLQLPFQASPLRPRNTSATASVSLASPSVTTTPPAPLPRPVFGPVSGPLDAASRAAAWANLEVKDGTEPFQPRMADAFFDGKRWVWRCRVGYGRGDLQVTVYLDDTGVPEVQLFRWVSAASEL